MDKLIYKIEYLLNEDQSSALERLAENNGLSVSEMLGKFVEKAKTDLLKELAKAPKIVEFTERKVATERELSRIAATFKISLATLESELFTEKGIKYCPDEIALRQIRRHLTARKVKE
jgi:hypothetical protein